MKQYLAILGRQADISQAELRALYGADVVHCDGVAAILNVAPDLDRIGGTIKVAKIIDTFESKNWKQVLLGAGERIDGQHISKRGKQSIGCSVYGERVSPKELNAAVLSLKKSLRDIGYSVRTVPNRTQTLNTAQITHNRLLDDRGVELIVYRHGSSITLAATVEVQDIDRYTARDHGKPVRDARNGMLPPKLAQIMLNLAQTTKDDTVLDPFCGTGTVLIEAMRNGSSVVGSDLADDMVDAAIKNTEWFSAELSDAPSFEVLQADAQTHHWKQPISAVVGETYLGPPLNHAPSPAKLAEVIKTVDALHRKTLVNLAEQLPSGAKICLAVPAWRVKQHTKRLPVVDDLENLGYNRLDLLQGNKPLLYYRPQAVVARELLVLIRK